MNKNAIGWYDITATQEIRNESKAVLVHSISRGHDLRVHFIRAVSQYGTCLRAVTFSHAHPISEVFHNSILLDIP